MKSLVSKCVIGTAFVAATSVDSAATFVHLLTRGTSGVY
jgi:hypothetical protein